MQATCVPMSAIFHALNWTHLDFMSLDTEGTEVEILLSIPWHVIDIDVIMVECNRCQYPNENSTDYIRKRHFMRTYLDIQGYDEVEYLTLDYVYVKRRH
jgi:hypothetical protein